MSARPPKAATSRKQGQLSSFSCLQEWLTHTSRAITTVLPSQGTGPTLPNEQPTRGWANSPLIHLGLASWYLPHQPQLTVLPRPGSVPILLSAAACQGHDQLTCSLMTLRPALSIAVGVERRRTSGREGFTQHPATSKRCLVGPALPHFCYGAG